MKCIVEGHIRRDKLDGCGKEAYISSPQLQYQFVCHAPCLFLDNRIYAVTGTSFCVPSGRWGGAVTGGLRR